MIIDYHRSNCVGAYEDTVDIDELDPDEVRDCPACDERDATLRITVSSYHKGQWGGKRLFRCAPCAHDEGYL